MEKLKVLVLGDGLLGSEIVKQTGWDYISRKKDNFDILEWYKIPNTYDVIVNCIANTDTYSKERYPHWLVNYYFVENLIKQCRDTNTKLVHISTDYIYAGSEPNATEKDMPIPHKSWYAYNKLLSDELVQLFDNSLICRCSHKPKPFPYEKAWNDQWSNTDFVDVIASKIITLINGKHYGVFNIGTERKTIFNLANRDEDDMTKYMPIPSPANAPKDVTMSTYKYDTTIGDPYLSIAIPAYGYNGKGAEFLKHNLEILTNQTFKYFEVVISDHSEDDTISDIVSQYERLLNIKYHKYDKGRGFISPNLNNAMRHCTGKWIKILFQDDFLYGNDSLEIQAKELHSNPNIEWAMTRFYHSNTGKDLYRYYIPSWNNLIWTGDNTMGCPSGMTLRNEDVIFFDENLNWLVDVDYYKKMFDKHGEPWIIHKPTYVNRTHGTGLSSTTSTEVKNKERQIVNGRYDSNRNI